VRTADVAGDLRIQFAKTGQDDQAAQTQNARSQPQGNRAHLSQAPPLVLLKPSCCSPKCSPTVSAWTSSVLSLRGGGTLLVPRVGHLCGNLHRAGLPGTLEQALPVPYGVPVGVPLTGRRLSPAGELVVRPTCLLGVRLHPVAELAV
jgi:hypothetical protein